MGSRRLAAFYTTFKYVIYTLLVVDCFGFMREDFSAAARLFNDGAGWRLMGATLAQTIDTWAWLVLLGLFEIETATDPRALIEGTRKWLLHGVRALCYVFVLYAGHGYMTKLAMFMDTEPVRAPSLCALSDGRNAYVSSLDEYVLLDAANCDALTRPGTAQRVTGTPLLAYADDLGATRRLALTDVINSIAWILVAAVLEIEVLLQLAGRYRGWVERASYAVKAALYAILAAAAVYWGVAGTFLDFRDAALWIAAFFFIELNLFRWGEAPGGPGSARASAA